MYQQDSIGLFVEGRSNWTVGMTLKRYGWNSFNFTNFKDNCEVTIFTKVWLKKQQTEIMHFVEQKLYSMCSE